MLRLLPLAALLLAGCSGATIDDAFGRPDATRWTYFSGAPLDVVSAIDAYYAQTGIAVESARAEAGGIVVTLAYRGGSASTSQVLVQATTVEGFASRAQLYPRRRPLPGDMENFIAGRF